MATPSRSDIRYLPPDNWPGVQSPFRRDHDLIAASGSRLFYHASIIKHCFGFDQREWYTAMGFRTQARIINYQTLKYPAQEHGSTVSFNYFALGDLNRWSHGDMTALRRRLEALRWATYNNTFGYRARSQQYQLDRTSGRITDGYQDTAMNNSPPQNTKENP